MTVVRGFTIIIIGGLGFGFGGGVVGYALARVAPFYYRGVFQDGESPGFDPVQVGIGLGVSQGLVIGVVVGSVVVLAVALSAWRHPAKGTQDLI